jgi:hypothetical protein
MIAIVLLGLGLTIVAGIIAIGMDFSSDRPTHSGKANFSSSAGSPAISSTPCVTYAPGWAVASGLMRSNGCDEREYRPIDTLEREYLGVRGIGNE